MPRTLERAGPESSVLQRRLAALRRRLHFVVTFRGAGWLVSLLLASALLGGLLDWWLHLPGLVRAVILVGTLSAAVYIAYRHLFLPLSTPADDLSLALRVEERYAGLNDALASTVQFLEEPADSDEHGSAGLRREAVRRALRRVEGCDFNQVIDSRGLWLAGLSLLVSTILAAVVIVFCPALAQTAFLRLANPFGSLEWPSQTQLDIDPPKERIGRNEAFEVRGRVRGVIPEKATVLFQFDGAGTVEHSCEITFNEDTRTGSFVTLVRPGQAQRKLRFQVWANDAVSPGPGRWYDVAVLPPPVLVPLDDRASPQLRLQPPAYTDLPAHDLPDGTGDLDVVAGTLVTLRAAVDRPLTRAWIEYEPEPRLTGLSAFLGPLGTVHSGSTVALLAARHDLSSRVPAELEAGRQVFTIRFLPRVNGRYFLHFEDDANLYGSRQFELHVRPDPPPLVNLERPSATRDILDALPTAELPLRAPIEDPEFAIRFAWLEYRVRPLGQPSTARTDPPRRLTLYDHRTAGAAVWGPFAGLARPVRLREKRVEIDQRLALAALPGIKLQAGDILTLQVCADDFDDVTVDKQPGRSHEVEIRIVNRDVLDVILNEEQKKVQQELVRLRKQEQDALQKVADTQAHLKQLGKLDGDDMARLQQAEQLQEQIHERVGARRQEGLRRDVARILETLRNNQLPPSGVDMRMKEVANQLDRLAREELEQIEARLASARRQAESPEEKQRERQRQAQALERLAEEREKEAEQAEKGAADRPDGDPVKSAVQRGAQQLRQQAQELRQTAQAVRQGREAQPEERERHARLLEQLAQEKAEQAAKAERLAEQQPEASPKHAELEEESRRLQQQAQELRQTAQEMRRGEPAEDEVKEQLAEARRHQEEVEKTLNDLLQRVLGPFSGTSEIRGEAKMILQEQRRLQQQTEELAQKLPGVPPEKMTPEQRTQVDQVRDAQNRLEKRTSKLLEQVEQLRKDRAKDDPETAQEMKAALDAARNNEKGDVVQHMQAAGGQLQQGKLNEAAGSESKSAKQLQEMVKQLEDKREAELDRLAKKMRELQKEVEKLADEQEQLQKKMKEAAGLADPKEREAALKKLAREQQQLQERAKQMQAQLSRMRMERAGQEMAKAAEQMENALRQLERGQPAEEPQDEALDRLEEARRELEQARKEVEEELAREQLAKIADALRALKERQEARNNERADLQRRIQQNNGWRGDHLGTLNREAEAQRALAQETETVARERLDGAPVFARILDRASQAMQQAGQRMFDHREAVQQRGKDAPPDEQTKLRSWQPADAAVFDQIAKRQQEALRRLEQLLDVLKDQAGRPMGGGGGGGGEGGAGGRPPGDAIPQLAQLKLLRTLQAEVNQQTAEFNKQHPDLSKLTKEEQAELQSIRRDQRDVADLLEEMTKPDNPQGDRP